MTERYSVPTARLGINDTTELYRSTAPYYKGHSAVECRLQQAAAVNSEAVRPSAGLS
jgi:hypothetical protein